jgi:hypothetical protein
VSADYPNHLQLTLDGVLTQLERIDMPSTLDAQSNSLRLALRSTVANPDRTLHGDSDAYELRIQLDAAGLPEGEMQVVQLDLRVSGQKVNPGWFSELLSRSGARRGGHQLRARQAREWRAISRAGRHAGLRHCLERAMGAER